ncbi:MAG TPA: TonB family protein [Gammaproteobacteria bacterium]
MISRTLRPRLRFRPLRTLPLVLGALLADQSFAQTSGGAAEDIDVADDLRELPELLDGTETDDGGRPGERPTDDVPGPGEPPPVTRLETLLEVNRLSDEGRPEDAVPLLEQLVRLTEEEFGAQSVEAAEAYEVAARIHREAGNHQRAEEYYLHAVDLVRNLDGAYTALAIRPLLGLGDNYHAAGQYLNAITAYNEARTVSRRAHGLLNEGQVPILDRLTESFEALDQYAEADEQQLTILHLAERNYPQASPEHLEAIYRYALWLRESGRYHDERLRYAEAMRLIRDAHGKESLLLVRPLRETANSYREQRLPENQGISALRSALELLDEHGAGNPLLRAEVLRDIGDWDVAFSKVDPDLSVYVSAWQLLGEVENGDELRREWFDELHSVFDEPISQRGLSRAPEARSGHVIVAFDVDRYGRTSDVRVAESEPPGFKDDAVVRAIRQWRFRPRVENGVIVARDDVALRVNFRYLPDEQAEPAE